MGSEVRIRDRLLVRLLAAALVIAVGSIAATAWLATDTATTALRQAEDRSLTADAQVYNSLLGYAATHQSWHGVGPTLAGLARRAGARVVLTSRSRGPLPGLAAERGGLPAVASALVDPLHVDAVLSRGGDASGIDTRALGPFALPPATRSRLERIATSDVSCLHRHQLAARIAVWPGGHPHIIFSGASALASQLSVDCSGRNLALPTGREAAALATLNRAINTCLGLQRRPAVQIGLALDFAALPAADRRCAMTAWRQQLAGYVAPPALLFITQRAGGGVLDLSGPNRWRVVLLALGVLALTLTVTFVLAARLTRPLRRLSEAIRSSEGAPLEVAVSSRDEIGQLTEALNRSSARQRQLEQQRRAMVRDIAHELRGPVSNIRNWLEAAEDQIVTPEELLDSKLLDEVLQLQHIVSDLADLAAADAGELTLHPESLAVAELVAQVLAAHQAAADAAVVSLQTELAAELTVHADGVRVRQVLGNLIGNAIRHTPPGGRIVVGARQAGADVEITVSDSGEGIAAGDVPFVFERFWRADRSRQRSTGGSGLGLAIARQFAEAHEGRLTLTSALGQGTVVTLVLPAHGTDADGTATAGGGRPAPGRQAGFARAGLRGSRPERHE